MSNNWLNLKLRTKTSGNLSTTQKTDFPVPDSRKTTSSTPNITAFSAESRSSTVSSLQRSEQSTVPVVVFGLTIGGLILGFAIVIVCLILYYRKQLHRHETTHAQYTLVPATSASGDGQHKASVKSAEHYMPMDGTGEATLDGTGTLNFPEYIEIFDSSQQPKKPRFFWLKPSVTRKSEKGVLYVNVKDKRTSDGATEHKTGFSEGPESDEYYSNVALRGVSRHSGRDETQELYENT